jgi:hypothetical protein
MREMTNLKSTIPRDGCMSCPSVASTLTPILEETHRHLVSLLTDRTDLVYSAHGWILYVLTGIPDDVG